MQATEVPLSQQVGRHKGRLACAVRDNDADRQADARRALAASKIAKYVEQTLAAAPPLTDDQRSEIVAIIGRTRPAARR